MPNILQPLGQRERQANREGLSEFGAVRPHQTSSNHCDEEGSQAYREGSSEVGAQQLQPQRQPKRSKKKLNPLWFVYIPDALFTSVFSVC